MPNTIDTSTVPGSLVKSILAIYRHWGSRANVSVLAGLFAINLFFTFNLWGGDWSKWPQFFSASACITAIVAVAFSIAGLEARLIAEVKHVRTEIAAVRDGLKGDLKDSTQFYQAIFHELERIRLKESDGKMILFSQRTAYEELARAIRSIPAGKQVRVRMIQYSANTCLPVLMAANERCAEIDLWIMDPSSGINKHQKEKLSATRGLLRGHNINANVNEYKLPASTIIALVEECAMVISHYTYRYSPDGKEKDIVGHQGPSMFINYESSAWHHMHKYCNDAIGWIKPTGKP
jgi:hypothetical protein